MNEATRKGDYFGSDLKDAANDNKITKVVN
jgi:hypothetical protein